jgi:hypothetical protein
MAYRADIWFGMGHPLAVRDHQTLRFLFAIGGSYGELRGDGIG